MQEYWPLWEELAICILDLEPEKAYQSQREDFVCKEQVDVAQRERGLVCHQDQAAKESWPGKHQLWAEGYFSRALRISDTGLSCLLVQLGLWQSGESNCWCSSVKFCLSWASFSCHCLSFSLKPSCRAAGTGSASLSVLLSTGLSGWKHLSKAPMNPLLICGFAQL